MSPARADRILWTVFATAWIAAGAPCAEAEWQPAVVQGRDGSELRVLIRTTQAPSLLKLNGDAQALRWADIDSIKLGDRWPSEMCQQAEKSVADLRSDDYPTRQKAIQQLRDLGAAASSALRKAAGSDDPEVATRTRELLLELGIGDATPDASNDRLVLKDGGNLVGRLSPETLDLYTRWGLFAFPLSALTALRASADNALAPPSAEMRTTPIQPAAVAPIGTAKPFSLADLLEDPAQPPSVEALNSAGFDEVLSGQQKLKTGDLAEDVYAAKGLLLRPADPKQRIVVDDSEPLTGRSGGLAACVNAPKGLGDMELVFIQPGSFDAQRRHGRPAGVHMIGLIANGTKEGHLALEAYDQHGRLLVRCNNQLVQQGVAAGAGSSFLGIRATVPIVRVRLFRMPGYEHQPLRTDDIFFDACVPADREPTHALLELRSGEHLVGRPENQPHVGEFAFRPSFLPPIAPAIAVEMKDIARYEPPLQAEESGTMPRPPGAMHAVRLQNGESFHARFVKLDAKQFALELPGGVQLTLPRGLVRKIDLCPQMAEAGAEPASMAAGEKPGVEFRPKRVAAGAAVPAKQEAELPRMDNADVVSADITTGELTVDPKDGAGEWRIDLFSTRYLVFPPAAEAAGNSKEREWVLRLRQGGCFSIALTGIAPDHLSAEMAGAKVTFPARTVAAVERKK